MLFILNVVVFGRLERKLDDDDMFFLPHSGKEEAKILWRDGAAVGFYTTKVKGEGTGALRGASCPEVAEHRWHRGRVPEHSGCC